MRPRNPLFPAILFLLITTSALADWESVGPGVQYQRFDGNGYDIHVARVDLASDAIRVVGSRESDRGTRVSTFAERSKAIVAINGDYFDDRMRPTGLAVGPCGPWADTRDTKSRAVVAFGTDRAELYPVQDTMETPEQWITAAVSGWPTLVHGCRALGADELPGSDRFTRTRHPRTAVGFDEERTGLFLVVAEGRREDAPGMTLAELAAFMHEELGVCDALNLDGGGSSAMWVNGRIVNRPSDGKERRVADHLGVVMAADAVECDSKPAVAKKSSSPAAPSPAPYERPVPSQKRNRN